MSPHVWCVQVCAEAGGGVVSVRDFVNIRHWASVEGGVLVSAGGSVTHPAKPPVKGKVRGENGPTCWALRPVQGRPDTCLFQWLLDTDLKVMLSSLTASVSSSVSGWVTHSFPGLGDNEHGALTMKIYPRSGAHSESWSVSITLMTWLPVFHADDTITLNNRTSNPSCTTIIVKSKLRLSWQDDDLL